MSEHARTRIRLATDAPKRIARAGLSLAEWARRADVGYATVKALRNPQHHPRRKGGMQPTTAWKLVRAYVAAAKLTATVEAARQAGQLDDDAYQQAIEEIEHKAYRAIIVEESIDTAEPAGAVAA